MNHRIWRVLALASVCAGWGLTPASAAPNWQGFYVGINAGGIWAKDDTTTTANPAGWTALGAAAIDAATPGSVKPSGFAVGGQAGMNWQAPGANFVWGIEGDVDVASGSASRSVTGFGGGVNPADVFSTETKNRFLATLRPRIGFASGDTLFYVTGGLAVGSYELTDSMGSFGNTVVATTSHSVTRAGWTLGGGVESAFAGNWSVKAEFLYVDMGTEDTSIPSCSGCVVGSDVGVHHDLSESVARFGINLKL